MSTSFGTLRLDYLFRSAELLGIGSRSTRWQTIAALLKASEGRAERLIECKFGVLVLISVPDQPNTGAIYLYHEPSRSFYLLQWTERADTLNGDDFELAVREYNLERYITEPNAIPQQQAPQANLPRRRHSRRHHHRKHAPAAAVAVAAA